MVKHLLLVLLSCFAFLAVAACSGSTADSPVSPQQDLGRRLFAQHCASCHVTSGDTVLVGPSLAGIASQAGSRVAGMDALSYLEQSILQPGAYLNAGYNDLMPKTFGQLLTSKDLDALISYLFTLK